LSGRFSFSRRARCALREGEGPRTSGFSICQRQNYRGLHGFHRSVPGEHTPTEILKIKRRILTEGNEDNEAFALDRTNLLCFLRYLLFRICFNRALSAISGIAEQIQSCPGVMDRRYSATTTLSKWRGSPFSRWETVRMRAFLRASGFPSLAARWRSKAIWLNSTDVF
jgi:hypothetical protein